MEGGKEGLLRVERRAIGGWKGGLVEGRKEG